MLQLFRMMARRGRSARRLRGENDNARVAWQLAQKVERPVDVDGEILVARAAEKNASAMDHAIDGTNLAQIPARRFRFDHTEFGGILHALAGYLFVQLFRGPDRRDNFPDRAVG